MNTTNEKRAMAKGEVAPNSIRAWFLAARPKTLSGAMVPVVLAIGLALRDDAICHPMAMLSCLAFAAVMQIAANFINDLYDFLKGTDREDRLGPERACAQGWISPSAMKWGIAISITIACITGCTLLFYGNPFVLIAIGMACVVGAFLYTTILSYSGLGDVMVLLFFGLVPVCGTYYVLSESINPTAVFVGVIAGVLIDTLLVINNYRDRDTDRRDGKRTLIAHFGEPFGRYMYLTLGWGAALMALFVVDIASIVPLVLMAFYLYVHTKTWFRMSAIRSGRALNGILGETSRNMILFAILLFASLLL